MEPDTSSRKTTLLPRLVGFAAVACTPIIASWWPGAHGASATCVVTVNGSAALGPGTG
jgi:hypothetical protein